MTSQFQRWLELWFGRKPIVSRRRLSRPVAAQLELFESRVMLSAEYWTGHGNGTAWSDPRNWSTGSLPDSTSDVTLDAPAGTTIHGPASATTINNLIVKSADLILDGGDVTVSAKLDIQNAQSLLISSGILAATNITLEGSTLTLSGGTIKNGTVTETGGAELIVSTSGGTLDGVTVKGNVDATKSLNGPLTVLNNLTLNGTLFVGAADGSTWGSVVFGNSQSSASMLAGNATLVFGSHSYNALYVYNAPGGALTWAPGVTVHGNQASIYGNSTPIINQGTFAADAGGTIRIFNSGFENQGTLNASNGGTLDVSGLTGNLGRATLAGTGSQLILSGSDYVVNQPLTVGNGQALTLSGAWTNISTITSTDGTLNLGDQSPGSTNLWTNTGTITTADSILDLGGLFTLAAMGNLNWTGTLNLTGTLDNTHTTLALNGASGSWHLSGGGTIENGTVTETGGAKLIAISGALVNVTVNGDVDVGLSQVGSLTVPNTLTLNGTMSVGAVDGSAWGSVTFGNSQSSSSMLAGNATLVFGSHSYNALYVYNAPGGALTWAPGVTVHGNQATIYGGACTIINQGMFSADADGTIQTYNVGLENQGTLRALNGGRLDLYALNGNIGNITETATGSISTEGNLLIGTTNPVLFAPQGKVEFQGNGTSTMPQLLEAPSQDLGNISTAYAGNSAFGTLALSNGTYVKLVDNIHNTTSQHPEAVYVNTLIIGSGSTLDLNGLHIYARATEIDGAVINGTVSQIPDAGPLTLGIPTPGNISTGGELDEWTFFGRAGTQVTVAVDPGSGSPGGPVSPILQLANVQLLDPTGTTILATTSNSTGGTVAKLIDIVLPSDGIYTIAVHAPSGNSSITGHYVVAAYDVTPTTESLNVNQTVTGTVAQPFSVDQWTFAATANTQVQFKLLAESASGLIFNLTGPNGSVEFANLTASSSLVTLPTSGIYTLTAQGTGGAIGSFAFQMVQTGQVALNLGAPTQGVLAASGQAQLYTVNLSTAGTLNVNLTDSNAGDQNEIYVAYGTPPTRDTFDYRFSGVPGADQQVLLPAQSGTYYILVYANLVQSPGSYSVAAQTQSFDVTEMTPGRTGTVSPTTVQFSGLFPVSYGQPSTSGGAGATSTGAYLSTHPTIQFISADGTTYPPTSVSLNPASSGTMISVVGSPATTVASAVLPAGTLPAGEYSVRVTDNTGFSQTLPNALTVEQGGIGVLKTSISVPNPIGFHVSSTVYVTYSNEGDAPLTAPLLVLTATQNNIAGALLTVDESKVVSGFWTASNPDGYGQSVQFLASGAVAGVLQPGESVTVPVYYAGWLTDQWDFSRPPINFSLGVLDTTDTRTIDWNSMKSSLQPASISTAAWNALFSNITSQLGSTWGDYVHALDNSAEYLAGVGDNVTDIGQLFNFVVEQANGIGPLSSLANAVDASVAAPGLALVVGRTFAPGIIARNSLSIFGWGWSTPWTTSLNIDADGSVNISGPGGSLRRFQPDSRGGYFDQTGDYATLAALPSGGFTLTELTGEITAFNSDGTLNYIQDTNANRITASYTNGHLTSLTHSAGQFLTLSYNSAGLVSQITDSAGRVTAYQYDATNQYLTAVVDFDGQTTNYTYDTGATAATAHALLSITHSDGSHDYYTYDNQGRLATAHRDGGADATTFGYQQGQTSVTNALGNTTVYSFDNRGLLLQVRNPLGNAVNYTYDKSLNLIKTTDAAGNTYMNTYDAFGNVTSSTDALGHTVHYTYNSLNGRLSSLVDAKGNRTLYGYDGSGDLTSTTYADGTIASVAYDPIGNVISSTDQMGQVTQYTNDAVGNVLTEKFADGTQTSFTYDSHENLITATDASGTTTLAYDVGDRLSKITYPSGRYLQYTYDAAGRRTQLVDQTGFTVNYGYDTLGNLSKLTDGVNNLIVQYTYDTVGRLSREDHGNGTYVTYAYDAAGELLHLVNYAPGGSVNSRFDYTYDSLGRRITEATVDGAWIYSYDATSELTHAIFTSTNSSIANQELAYSYDAAGNRTQTIINAVTTEYSTNNMNEYTQVGNTRYAYDANGNQISATDSDGTTNYSFDVQNRLVGVSGAIGSWSYRYDAFGGRVAKIQNGTTTQNLIDPTGLGNVIASFDQNGGLVTNYIYGVGLTSQVVSRGVMSYFDFDANGSTVGVSDAGGAYTEQYAYLPFGEAIYSNESSASPFQFVGQWGVITDSSALYFMRARYMDPSVGRFISSDPAGINTPNLFAYANNLPTMLIDPSGRDDGSAPFVVRRVDGEPNPELHKFSDDDDIEFWKRQERAAASEQALIREIATRERVFIDNYLGIALTVASVFVLKRMGVNSVLARVGVTIPQPSTLSQRVHKIYNVLVYGQVPNPPDSNSPGGSSGSTAAATSSDPNSVSGPAGFGAQSFVDPSSVLPYKINFENAPAATAPAQRVVTAEQLDPSLDWKTFQWSSFSFGDTLIQVPATTQNYQTTVPMTYNGVSFRVIINLSLNPATGVVTAVFQSLNALVPGDPFSDLPPSVLIGFLPPEDGTGRGNGSISYTVSPKSGLPTGTEIRTVALVTFDQNYSIATNQVSETDPSQGTDPGKEALVTIDAGVPTAVMVPLPAVVETTDFTISWSGQDDAGGSGVATYDIYVATDGGDWMPLLLNTTLTSTTFHGVANSTYQFAAVATDNVGLQELGTLSAETTAKVVPGVTGPTDIVLSNNSVDENLPSGTTVGVLSTVDSDAGDTFTYSFVTGTGAEDNSNFTIDSSGHLKTAASFDFEAKGTYAIRVRTTDQANRTFEKQFTVVITNVNEAPVLATPGPVATYIGKVKTPVTVFPTLSVTDPDGSAVLASITISLQLGASRKNPDIVTIPGLSAIGTRVDRVVSGRLQITITLKPGATAAAVQTMLDGLTFQTKGAGLKSLSRDFQLEVTDQYGLQSNLISQTLHVKKKIPKVRKTK